MSESDPKLSGELCRCPSCGEYFTGDNGFQRHRIGPIDSRQCLTREQMARIGMVETEKKRGMYWAWGTSLAALGFKGTIPEYLGIAL